MTVQVKTADFRKAISIATKVVERRNTLPILETLRCRANGKLEVVGTDLDIALAVAIPRSKGKDAAFSLMAPRQIGGALAVAGGDAVSLVFDGNKVAVATGALSLSAGTLPADDFPIDIDRPLTADFEVTLSPAHIKSLSRITSSISKEETRYYLNGINFKRMDGNRFRAASTDGHRLSYIDLELPDAAGDLADIIIPRKVVGLLRDLGGKSSEGIKLRVGSVAPANQDDSLAPGRVGALKLAAWFDANGAAVSMVAKLIDGKFPDYSRVIPQNNANPMLFKVADLRRAIRAVSGFSKHVRAVKMEFTGAKCSISAAYVDISLAAAIDVPCEHKADGFEIGFNGEYLLALIDAAGGDEIILNAGATSADPVLIQNPSDTEWGGVLMPMRV